MTVTGIPSEAEPQTPVEPEPQVKEPQVTEPHASLRERKKVATRRLLRRAALNLVAERGFSNVTVEDIAEAADVSPRTFFNYFPSKEAVLFSGDPERTSALRDRIATCLPGRPPLEVLRAVLTEDADSITQELSSLGGNPQDWLRRMKTARQDPHVRAAHAGQMAMNERAIAEGLAARLGIELEAELYPGLLATVACGAVRACMSFWASAGGVVSLSELISQSFQALADGLPEHAALRGIARGKAPGLRPTAVTTDFNENGNNVTHRKDGL